MSVQTHLPRRPSVKDIREIFPSATAVGIALPQIGRGLVVVFHRRAEFADELEISHPTSKIGHQGLFELTKTFGFVVLKNCTAHRLPDDDASKLSRGKDFDGKFIQDPYHYDVAPPDSEMILPAEGYMSGIYKKTPEAREADTFYVIEDDVKRVIPQLNHDGLCEEVRDALDVMAKPDYHFRLYNPDETPARKVIRQQYPEFVDDVFQRIPEERKYRQRWLKDVWDIFICSNVFGDGLHARPTGHMMTSVEAPINPLRGMYLVQG